MRWCWTTWFHTGECSRLPAQHKKKTFDQASVCVRWEYGEWKYQKMSEVGGLDYRFSGVQSGSRVEAIMTERSKYCIHESMGNQCREARWREMWTIYETLRTKWAALFWTFCSLLRDTEDSQKEESCNNRDVKEQRQRQESLWHLLTEDDGWN